MSAVPEKVLNWLYSVLTSEYHDVNRTYSNVAEALSHYPSLSPRTEVYTYENGTSALLLLLSGTIPVQFRGTTYRFPIALWIPHNYPKESPIVYVTPSQGMLVRPGQHVSGDGRVYHPYLAQWGRYWDKSSIFDFLAVLRGVFAKEPPVISKQAQQQPSQATPPPIPPPPKEWQRSQSAHTQSPVPQEEPKPPPVPPKGAGDGIRTASPLNRRPLSMQSGPPVPLSPQTQPTGRLYKPQNQWQDIAVGTQAQQLSQNIPQKQSSTESAPSYKAQQLPPHMRYQQSHHELDSPVSPVTPSEFQRQPFTFHKQSQTPYNHHQQDTSSHTYQSGPPLPPTYTSPPSQPRKPPQPAIDLLTSPLDVTLPSQNGIQEPILAPPIPPNPEKDAVLHALSQTLVSQTQQILTSNQSATTSLTAQQQALRNAHAVLQSELEQLQQLDRALESNENILHSAMQEAEKVMHNATGRRRPEVDEVLVCPTVVGGQLYNLVAEQRACEEARLALGRGLDKGRISLEVFVKQTRSLAREEFLKKALIRKASRGMGLDERAWR